MVRPGMKLAAAVALAVLFTTSIAEHDHSHVHSHGHDHDHSHGHSHDHDHHDHRHVHHDHHVHQDGHDSHAKEAVVEIAVDDVGHAHHAGHSSHHGDHGHDHQHDDDHGHSHDHRDLRRPIPGPVETLASPSTHDHNHEHADKHDHNHDHEHVDAHKPAQAHTHEHDQAHPSHSSHHHSHEHAHDHSHDHSSHDHSHSHAHHGHTDAARLLEGNLATSAADRFDVSLWVEALSATALVGLAPVVLLFFIPLGRASLTSQKPLLRIFLAFAAGGLLGDALLHLLPHSIPSGHHDHDHSHDHSEAGHSHSVADLAPYLWTLAGLITFLMLEKFVRAQTGGGGHGHSHGAAPEPKPSKKTTKDGKDEEAPVPVIAAAAYLNLAADFSHNFTDGLAIGATFVHGRSSGWQTTLAMLLHEVPHEIGDFAILIQSGFTRSEAMWTQVYTALGAMVGTAVGLLIEAKTAAWITPFTAGGFVYIACTSVFPELLEDSTLVQSLLQLVAMGTGVALMLLIALYE